MTRYYFENYDDAAEYLSRARKRDKGRPLPGNGTRLMDMGKVNIDGTIMRAIGIYLYRTCVIRYLKTSSGKQWMSASTGGWVSQTTTTRLTNYLPRGFGYWRLHGVDLLAKTHGLGGFSWGKAKCYLLTHDTLFDAKSKKIRYEKRRAVDATMMFQDNTFEKLNVAYKAKRKYLLNQGKHLTEAENKLIFQVRGIESMQEKLNECGDPLKALAEVLDATAEQVKLLQLVKLAKEGLEEELAFLEHKKKEHYAPEQERSILNRV